MNRYFTTNVLRMFQNRKIYICTLGMALTLYMSGIAFIRSDGDSANLQDAFSVVSSSGFIILFYLLCVIGGGLSYCEDCNSGFTRYAVVRGDAKKYIRGHLFSAALGGCASMLGGMALYELLMARFMLCFRRIMLTLSRISGMLCYCPCWVRFSQDWR